METGPLLSLQEWRDICLILFTSFGTLLFLVATIVTAGTGWLTWRTLGKAKSVVTNLGPAVENVRDTTATVKGTVTFISDTAVKPVVRAYGTYAGARRFITVMARFTRPKAGG
jgi:hypothetical protein